MKDDRVSRRHLRVYPVDDEWHVQDLDSLNGSYVNGQSIDERKVDPELDVSLDKHGPKIHLLVRPFFASVIRDAKTQNSEMSN